MLVPACRCIVIRLIFHEYLTYILPDIIEIFSRYFLKYFLFFNFPSRLLPPGNTKTMQCFESLVMCYLVLPWTVKHDEKYNLPNEKYFVLKVKIILNNEQQISDWDSYLEILIIRHLAQCHLSLWFETARAGWAELRTGHVLSDGCPC